LIRASDCAVDDDVELAVGTANEFAFGFFGREYFAVDADARKAASD
jgi:hypothetical protein